MIYLVITASLENKYGIKDDEHRKSWYISSITRALEYAADKNIKAVIVENNGQRPTYLDDLGCDVVYTDNNTIATDNKAVNELLDIKHIIKLYNIADEDTIIKLTGRYKMINDSFFRYASNPAVDACIKFFNVYDQVFTPTDCILGLFSIKCKFLKDFEYQCKKSPEVEFAIFARSNVKKLKEIRFMSLLYCLAMNFKQVFV